jgi:YidC/Oxa1 family membrane protein insertase
MIGSIFVDPIRAVIFTAAHFLGGSLGAGVLAVSLLLRVALMPLTLRLARRAAARQRALAAIQPELKALTARHAKDAEQLHRKTMEVYARAGVSPVDGAGLLGNFAQLPVLGGMYGALRRGASGAFGWMSDIAQPNLPLAVASAVLAGLAAYVGAQPGTDSQRMYWLAAGAGTAISLFIFWHASAALVLSWTASSAVNAIQGALLVRERRAGQGAA